ncbi:MAG: hypothetical protein QM765_21065 [Myxococcales bacterium]
MQALTAAAPTLRLPPKPTAAESSRYCAAMSRLCDRQGFPALGRAYAFAAVVDDAAEAFHAARTDRKPKGA